MYDFDLSQALESSTESGENAFESCTCIFMDELLNVDVRLDLVDCMPPNSMRGIAMLAVALNRMKPFQNRSSTDENMSMLATERLLDDNIVRTIVHGLTSSSSEKSISFRPWGREECTLCDTKHKNLVRSDENQCDLLATTLKGGSFSQRVKFKLTRCRPAPPPNHHMRLVVFTIVSNNTLLCCSWQGEEPVLKLEACSDKEEVLTKKECFLFYMKTTGKDLKTFESVKYRGWFISTSQEEGQPVQMCQENTTRREINFKVNP